MDLNASGHLDNLQILRAVDEARHRLLGVGEPGGPQILAGLLQPAPPEVAMLVAAHRVEYRRELWYAAAPSRSPCGYAGSAPRPSMSPPRCAKPSQTPSAPWR